MVKPLQRYAKVGLLLALFVGLIGAQGDRGCRQMAMKVWADLQAQLDSQQEQLDTQEERICHLYFHECHTLPPECRNFSKCGSACSTDPGCGGHDHEYDEIPDCEGEDCR